MCEPVSPVLIESERGMAVGADSTLVLAIAFTRQIVLFELQYRCHFQAAYPICLYRLPWSLLQTIMAAGTRFEIGSLSDAPTPNAVWHPVPMGPLFQPHLNP